MGVMERPDDRRKVKLAQTCSFRFVLRVDGEVLQELDPCIYTISDELFAEATLLEARVIDKALLSMKRGEHAVFTCTATCGLRNPIPFRGATLSFDVVLRDFVEISDVSFEKDGTVMLKSLRSRDAWTRCCDAGICTLHVARISDWEEIVVNSWEVTFVLGNGDVCDALECAVAAMRVGEVAEVTCSSSDMCAVPCLNLSGCICRTFSVQVLAYQGGALDGATTDLQKVDFVEQRRVVGMTLYRAGRFKLASWRFKVLFETLGHVDDCSKIIGAEDRRRRVKELKQICLLNRALCAVKAGNQTVAIAACNLVLEEERCNVKALYRRAQALAGLGCGLDALRDLRSAMVLEPRNSEVRQLYRLVVSGQQVEDKSMKPFYAKMCEGLGRLPHPLDVD